MFTHRVSQKKNVLRTQKLRGYCAIRVNMTQWRTYRLYAINNSGISNETFTK